MVWKARARHDYDISQCHGQLRYFIKNTVISRIFLLVGPTMALETRLGGWHDRCIPHHCLTGPGRLVGEKDGRLGTNALATFSDRNPATRLFCPRGEAWQRADVSKRAPGTLPPGIRVKRDETRAPLVGNDRTRGKGRLPSRDRTGGESEEERKRRGSRRTAVMEKGEERDCPPRRALPIDSGFLTVRASRRGGMRGLVGRSFALLAGMPGLIQIAAWPTQGVSARRIPSLGSS